MRYEGINSMSSNSVQCMEGRTKKPSWSHSQYWQWNINMLCCHPWKWTVCWGNFFYHWWPKQSSFKMVDLTIICTGSGTHSHSAAVHINLCSSCRAVIRYFLKISSLLNLACISMRQHWSLPVWTHIMFVCHADGCSLVPNVFWSSCYDTPCTFIQPPRPWVRPSVQLPQWCGKLLLPHIFMHLCSCRKTADPSNVSSSSGRWQVSQVLVE